MQFGVDLSNHIVKNGGKSALPIAFMPYSSLLKYPAAINDLGLKKK